MDQTHVTTLKEHFLSYICSNRTHTHAESYSQLRDINAARNIITLLGLGLYKWNGKQRQDLHSASLSDLHSYTHTHTFIQVLAVICCDKREEPGLGSLCYFFTLMIFVCTFCLCCYGSKTVCMCSHVHALCLRPSQ